MTANLVTPSMRLYHQAVRAARWEPRALSFAQDAQDWSRLTATERDLLLRLTALFHAGEERMTLDVEPLLLAMAREGRVDDERFLETLVADEAKHTAFFQRVLADVCGEAGDLQRFHTPSFRGLFYEELPRVMRRLLDDPAPAAQAEALVTYTIIGEGVLSETGHHLYVTALRRCGLMPGLLQGLLHVQRDEARHMTYGVYLLSRLVAADAGVWQAIQRRMEALLVAALDIVSEFFAPYAAPPFGLTLADTVRYAIERFARRSARIEHARDRGAAIAARVGDPVEDLLDWLGAAIQPLAVQRGGDPGSGVVVLEVRHEAGPASLLITPEVLDHYLADEIIAALTEEDAPRRLAGEPRLRLSCWEASGRIVVQPARGDVSPVPPRAAKSP